MPFDGLDVRADGPREGGGLFDDVCELREENKKEILKYILMLSPHLHVLYINIIFPLFSLCALCSTESQFFFFVWYSSQQYVLRHKRAPHPVHIHDRIFLTPQTARHQSHVAHASSLGARKNVRSQRKRASGN